MGTPNDDTFAAEVDSVVAQLTKNEKGKLVLPEGVEASEHAMYAAKIEVRRRDTYSSYSKIKNENVALQSENTEMAKQWEEDALANLSGEDRAELAELKGSDVDAYIAKKEEHIQVTKEKFGERRAKVKEVAKNETEVERRTRVVAEYNEAHPTAQLTQEVIDNDIPPRMLKDVETGKTTFDEFVVKASAYLTANKVIGMGETKEEEPNLSNAGGSHVPDASAVEKDMQNSYKKEIF